MSREPKKAMMGAPSIQDAAIKAKLQQIHRKVALDIRDTIRSGRYLIAIFPIDKDGDLGPEPGLHTADVPWAVFPEIVGQFKDRMQGMLASRRKAEDDGKGTLEIIDEVLAENTPAEEVDDVEPVDPAE